MTLTSHAALLSNGSYPEQCTGDRIPGPAANSTELAPLTILIAVPTLEIGAADAGVVDLASMLVELGHRPIVASAGGRFVRELEDAHIACVTLDLASHNPAVMVRNAMRLQRLVRQEHCDVVHAHGRSAAWSACLAARVARVPFVTSWYKGFREQNLFKRGYNSVMARGDRVVAGSTQIADLIVERHRTPRRRIAIVPGAVDFDRFDPGALTPERLATVRDAWGVSSDTRTVLIAGRMLRRKGHHIVVRAAQRLKAMGVKNFMFVFAGEDQGRSRYTGELWDLVLATDTADVIRMARSGSDLPAAYGTAMAVVSAAVQPEGVQRSILESLAMARPTIVSELAVGPDIVLAPPAVPEDRMTGLRIPAGDDEALALALVRLFAMPEPVRRAIGRRGREWVLAHCSRTQTKEQLQAVYTAVVSAARIGG